MYVAAKLSVPSLERKWKVPEPVGDLWRIPLPFRITTDEEAFGFMQYIREFLEAYRGEETAVFRLLDLNYEERAEPGKHLKEFLMDVAVAPYETGVRQEVKFSDIKDLSSNQHLSEITITRKAGGYSNWKTQNLAFIDLFRKQVLVWRSLSAEEREAYSKVKSEMNTG